MGAGQCRESFAFNRQERGGFESIPTLTNGGLQKTAIRQ